MSCKRLAKANSLYYSTPTSRYPGRYPLRSSFPRRRQSSLWSPAAAGLTVPRHPAVIERNPDQNEAKPGQGRQRRLDERVSDDDETNERENDRHQGVTPDSIRALERGHAPPEKQDSKRRHPIKEPAARYHVSVELAKRADVREDNGPYALDHKRQCGGFKSRMNASDGSEKDAVAGHGEADAPSAEDVAVECAENRTENQRGHECRPFRPGQNFHGFGRHPLVAVVGQHTERQHAQIGKVGAEVDEYDDRGPQHVAPRQDPSRIFYFARRVGKDVPALIGPQGCDEAHAERSEGRMRCGQGLGRQGTGDSRREKGESEDNTNAKELCGHESRLHRRAFS